MSYPDFVSGLVKDGDTIAREITGAEAHLLHMAVGIAGEAGELLDAIKKHCIYKKPLDEKNVVEELGDLEFYMQGLRSALMIPREFVITQNMQKLSKRYSGGTYSDKDAQERKDKDEK